jgi:hypothetical protein
MRLPFVLAVASAAILASPSVPHAAGLVAGIDGMTSTVMQKGQSSFSGVAVRLRLKPASLTQSIEIMPSIEYWRNTNTVQGYDIKSSRRDATLGVDARYRFTKTGWTPFVGTGLGLHFLSNEVNAPALGIQDVQTTSMKAGVALMGGVNFPMSARIDNFFELKYHMLSGSEQLKLNWGLGVSF